MHSGRYTAAYYGREDHGREYRMEDRAVFDRRRQAELDELHDMGSATPSSWDDRYGGRDYRGANTVERRVIRKGRR